MNKDNKSTELNKMDKKILSDFVFRFKKWLRTPMNNYDKIYAVIIWTLLILSLIFWNEI